MELPGLVWVPLRGDWPTELPAFEPPRENVPPPDPMPEALPDDDAPPDEPELPLVCANALAPMPSANDSATMNRLRFMTALIDAVAVPLTAVAGVRFQDADIPRNTFSGFATRTLGGDQADCSAKKKGGRTGRP